MRVTLIETEGRGGAAEIELDDRRLRVVDGISPADRPAAPGPVANPKLEVVVNPRLTERAPADPTPPNGLEPGHGWRYRAHAEIVSTQPLRADLGPLHLELEDTGSETWEVGDRVTLAIDRIVIRAKRS